MGESVQIQSITTIVRVAPLFLYSMLAEKLFAYSWSTLSDVAFQAWHNIVSKGRGGFEYI